MSNIEAFFPAIRTASESVWDMSADEGQLAVDVYDAGEDIVVVAPMAGAVPASIEVFLQNDLLTIRGKRPPLEMDVPVLHAECFWGKFSRTIVLPMEVQSEFARAEYANGVLTLSIPKSDSLQKVPVNIVDV